MSGSRIIPGLRYHDCRAMIDWLCAAFGFQRHLVVEDDAGGIAHAQLTRGRDMIMVGSVREDAYHRYYATPRATGGRCTMSAYVVVDDIDALHQSATAAGAEVIEPPTEQDYGGSNASYLDPEGNIWHFGTYDPWAEPEA